MTIILKIEYILFNTVFILTELMGEEIRVRLRFFDFFLLMKEKRMLFCILRE